MQVRQLGCCCVLSLGCSRLHGDPHLMLHGFVQGPCTCARLHVHTYRRPADGAPLPPGPCFGCSFTLMRSADVQTQTRWLS